MAQVQHFTLGRVTLADPPRAGFTPEESSLTHGQKCVSVELKGLTNPEAVTALRTIWKDFDGAERTAFTYDSATGDATLGAIVNAGVPISARTTTTGWFGPAMHKRIDETIPEAEPAIH